MKEQQHIFTNKMLRTLLIPVIFEQVLNSLMGTVDTMMVSNVGSAAISAVSLVDSINVLVIQAFSALAAGGAILCSQYIGQKNHEMANKSARQVLFIITAISVAVTALCLLFRVPLLKLIFGKVESDVMTASQVYFFYTALSFPFIALYDAGASIFRSQGNTRGPMTVSVISNVINIGGNAALIWGFNMGVAGAATATVVSQALSGVGCLIVMKRRFPILHLSREEWKWDGKCAVRLCSMGVPMGLQYSITAIGSVILQASVNTLGSQAVACVTAGSRIGMFFCCPYDAMGSTMSTYAGQNVGARKIRRVSEGLKSCTLLGLLYSAIACLILCLFGSKIALLFVSAQEVAILGKVQTFLIVNSAFYFPLALVNIVRFTIQGMGFSMLAVVAGVCEMVARSLVAFVFVPMFGYIAVCFASPVAWVFADIFLIPAFLYCIRSLQKQESDLS